MARKTITAEFTLVIEDSGDDQQPRKKVLFLDQHNDVLVESEAVTAEGAVWSMNVNLLTENLQDFLLELVGYAEEGLIKAP